MGSEGRLAQNSSPKAAVSCLSPLAPALSTKALRNLTVASPAGLEPVEPREAPRRQP